MKLELQKNRDFWAGLMLMVIGAAAIFISRDYRFGSASRMGPGFFPMILGGILVGFGICVMGVGLRSREKIQVALSLRALILLPLSLVLFGVAMERAGFIPALVVLVFVASASGREVRIGEVLLTTVFLALLSVVVFIWGLGLPYPLVKGFW